MSAHDMDAIRHCALARAPMTIAQAAPQRREKRSKPLADDKPLAGQAAIVTGGVRRIGRAIALALARAGAAVVINARSSRAEAEQVAQEVEAAGGRARVALADVTDG